jgi:hypothetical protein
MNEIHFHIVLTVACWEITSNVHRPTLAFNIICIVKTIVDARIEQTMLIGVHDDRIDPAARQRQISSVSMVNVSKRVDVMALLDAFMVKTNTCAKITIRVTKQISLIVMGKGRCCNRCRLDST